MYGTILQQGSFIAPTGVAGAGVTAQLIKIPSCADFVYVRNITQMAAAGSTAPAIGYEFFWQRGMTVGSSLVKYKTNALLTTNDDVINVGGISVLDPNSAPYEPIVGASIVTTAATNATQPVVSTADTSKIAVGSIVQKYDAQDNLDGIPMYVSAVTAGVNFTLLTATNALQAAPGVIGGAGTYRVVSYPMFYPRTLYITNMTVAGNNITVATSVQHRLTQGQLVRFSIPSQSGAVQLNSTPFTNYQTFTIQSVGAAGDTFVILAPLGGITAFTFPTIAQRAAGCQYPIVVPVGMDSGFALNPVLPQSQVPTINGLQVNGSQVGILADARVNTSYLSMYLGTGGTAVALNAAVSGPAGYAADDVCYWIAGKSEIGGL